MLKDLWDAQQGLRCVVAIDHSKKLRHYYSKNTGVVLDKVQEWEDQGFDVFFTPFVFDSTTVDRIKQEENKAGRRKEAAAFTKAFWIDIDCGEGKPYDTRKDGLVALSNWLKSQNVPVPSYIVSSGYGLHCYWLMSFSITQEVWEPVADRLKRSCLATGFRIDPARTGDAASILRVPGTTNHKYGKTVSCKVLRGDGKKHELDDFVKTLPTVTPRSVPTKKDDSKWSTDTEYPPADAELIANKCPQMEYIKEKGGAVEEPLWRAGLSILTRCVDGEHLIHTWSKGDKRYDADETEAKAKGTLGPATCQHFSDCAPEQCKGCKFFGKITSPIMLGTEPQEPEPIEDDEQNVYLSKVGNYTVTKSGVMHRTKDEDTMITCIPVWVTQVRERVSNDEHADSSLQLVWRLIDGRVKRAYLPQTDLCDIKQFSKWLARHNLLSQVWKPMDMIKFISATTRELIKNNQVQSYYDTLGWHNDASLFVLGKHTITPEGVEESNVQSSNPISRIDTAGDVEAWVEATRGLSEDNMEFHAFTVLCGFASPLLHLCGVNSAVVSLAGESGFGKTLMANMALSIYGQPEYLHQSATATVNAVERQLSSNQHVPYLLDEVSGLRANRLADFLYVAANGRAKDSLTRGRETRFAGSWQLIPMITTNRPLSEFQAKDIQEAHRRRLLELYFGTRISNDTAIDIVEAIRDNYGTAAEPFITTVMQIKDKIPALFQRELKRLTSNYSFDDADRFILWTITSAKVAGAIAMKAGLIKFDPNKAIDSVATYVSKSQKHVMRDADRINDILANYLILNKKNVNRWNGTKEDLGDIVDAPFARYDPTDNAVAISTRTFHKILLEESMSLQNLKPLFKRYGVEQKNCRLAPVSPVVWSYVFPCEPFGLNMEDALDPDVGKGV